MTERGADGTDESGGAGASPAQAALAIMSRYPRAGMAKTRLAAGLGAREAAALYGAFLRDLARRFGRAARRDGYTLIWAHTPGLGDLRELVGETARLLAQRGNDLGERLFNVCADLGAEGFARVVVLGSDSPHIPARWVRAAFAELERRPAVLGPAEDGGYYLVGVRTAPAPPDLFRGIQMSTDRVYTQTLERAAALGIEAGRLPRTFDVDEAADLARLAHALARPGRGAASSPHTLAVLRRLGLDEGWRATRLTPRACAE